MSWLTPAKRKAIYGVLAALGALAQTLGLLSADDVAHWLDVATQVLAVAGLVMAFVHTDTSTSDGMSAEEEYVPEPMRIPTTVPPPSSRQDVPTETLRLPPAETIEEH